MIVRAATEADVAAIRDVLVRTWHATYDAIFGVEQVNTITSAWHTPERIRAGLAEPGNLTLVAEVDGQVVGTLGAGISGRSVALHRLYILPEMQGRGLGKGLFKAMVRHYPEAGRITLEVEPRNRPAIAFYERLGFAVTGGGAACGGDTARNYPHLIMEKPLG